jgi:hypothetical protein
MNTKSPTWNNINYFFRNVHLGLVQKQGQIIHTTLKGITQTHEFVLQLLGVSSSAYTTIKDQWWLFQNAVLPKVMTTGRAGSLHIALKGHSLLTPLKRYCSFLT